MPDREAEVFVQLSGEDVFAGRLWAHRRRNIESATFAYAADYLARKDSYPLDPALPLVTGQLQTPAGRGIFGAFSDCAPDRWGRMLIRRRYRVSDGSGDHSFGEIDYLLGVRDDLRQGALRFRDPAGGEFLADEHEGVPHLVDLPRLLDYAGRAERDVAGEEELDLLLTGGSSLGGARPKAHVIDGKGRLAIAKFPKAEGDEWDVTGWEAVTLRLAREAGIDAASSELADVAGRSVHVVDRFDRRGSERVAYASAMTLLEATDGEDRSYLDLVGAIETNSERATADIRELWRRIGFSILAGNTDDHLRNHGFIRTGGGGWSLSPAFDINPNPEPGPKFLSTSIDGGSGAADVELLLGVAELFRLDEREALKILAELSQATGRWRDVARNVGLDRASIEQMRPAFEHPTADLARGLASA
jgi:serine/threonine-protein kinase HipA